MSAPDAPPDNSYAIEAQRIAAQERAKREETETLTKRRGELAELRTGSANAARGNASRYFTEQGLDPAQYSNDIDERINEILGTISQDDANPGTYFNDLGEDVYQDEESAYRGKQSRKLNELFPTNFETDRIQDTMDDDILAAIKGEQRGSAEQLVNNMLARGVITGTGKNTALADLDRQSFSVQDRLRELGSTTLAGGRQSLTNIANRGKQAAGSLNLGQSFDPFSYTKDTDAAFNDFINNLSGSIRAKVPGQLFDTSNLAAIAGAGQGAQNTAFDPAALAGIIQNNQPKRPGEEENAPENIF